MILHRSLPQLQGKRFITDGGLETTAIFNDGFDLPAFSSLHLLQSEKGQQYLKSYFEKYIELATQRGLGFILETPTWRASADWAPPLNVSIEELNDLNRKALKMAQEIKISHHNRSSEILIAGSVGPRGDGYNPAFKMSAEEAKAYHSQQIRLMQEGGVDFVSALTMSYVEEALGITLACRDYNLPLCVSFTVETDGRLATGQSLEDAIQFVDQMSDSYPSYYMINCAHPTHFIRELRMPSPTVRRIRGIRANASCKSHAELNNSTTLDYGNPDELGQQLSEIEREFPHMTVLGGCCGTDMRHIERISYYRSRNGN